MAIDDGDRADIMAEVEKKLNGMVKAVTDKVAAKVAEQMAKVVEDGVSSKLAEAQKAQADAAKKVEPLEEERKTVRQRIEALEAERDAAKAEAKAQRVDAAFRKAWAGPKFIAELADDHMAALDKAKRLVMDDDGTVRVIDPKKAKEEVMPTVDEYVSGLAKTDRGRLYQGSRTSPGQDATFASSSNGARPKMDPGDALRALTTGQTNE